MNDNPRDLALWLARNVSAIACDEAAGECFAAIADHTRRIERMINRPTPPRFIGPCDTEIERQRCGLMLTAKPGAVEVVCPRCKVTHNVERLETRLLNEIDYYRFTRAELAQVCTWLGEPIPRQTMHDWIKAGKLRARGYRRPDGRYGLARHSDADKAVYRLADVRKLRAAMPVRKVRAG